MQAVAAAVQVAAHWLVVAAAEARVAVQAEEIRGLPVAMPAVDAALHAEILFVQVVTMLTEPAAAAVRVVQVVHSAVPEAQVRQVVPAEWKMNRVTLVADQPLWRAPVQ